MHNFDWVWEGSGYVQRTTGSYKSGRTRQGGSGGVAVVAKPCVIKGYVIQVCSYTCDECGCRGITCESATGDETGQLTACIKDTKEERETRKHSVRIHDGLRQSSTGCSAVHGRCGWICEAQGRPAGAENGPTLLTAGGTVRRPTGRCAGSHPSPAPCSAAGRRADSA